MIERVVVTGATGGIGSACVELFQEHGAEVVGVDSAPTSGADDHLMLDLGTPECGSSLLDHLGDRPIDLLVNNAAVALYEEAAKTSAGDFDKVISVNLRAPFLLSVAMRPILSTRRGSIVNISSVHALVTSVGVSVYAASKGGLASLTRALALEWGPEVRVNCVLPGAVDTDMLTAGLSRTDSTLRSLGPKHAVGRVGDPREVAEAVRFLASSEYVTGAALVVDGGASVRLGTE
jgi:NAD(P)-dependent dehydrogenase (short-subunit alcohol dehydrogenase family)